MTWLIVLLALALGFLVGRRWVLALPLLFVAVVTGASLVENLGGDCTRPDGCGWGPVALAFLASLAVAALLAAVLLLGIALRRRVGGRLRRGGRGRAAARRGRP